MLNIVSLSERAITDFKNLYAADKSIDFQPVNIALDKEREKADEYLLYMLMQCDKKLKKERTDG